jgi:hypothetical protein
MQEPINFKENIDPKLKKDTKLNIGDKEFTYEEIKSMYPIHKQDPIRCLVYWDDLVQLTSIGLIEILNSLYKTDVKVDILDFLNRDNENIYGIQYVYKLFKGKLTKNQILDVKKKFYWKLMEISCNTSLYKALTNMSTYYSKIGFFFPYKFENSELLKTGLREVLFPNAGGGQVDFFFGENGLNLNNIMKNGAYNVVITPNIVDTYDFIIKNDLENILMLGPNKHNGVTEDIVKLFQKLGKLPKPNYCDIKVFPEQLLVM